MRLTADDDLPISTLVMYLEGNHLERTSLSAAVEQAEDSIVITDTTGIIQYVNPSFTAMTGYTSEEAVGQNPRVLKSGRHPLAFYEQLWKTICSGQPWHGELTNRRKDGTLYQEEMRITPVRDSNGEIASFLAIKHDVTERRTSEDAKALLAAIVENSEDAIVACTPDGLIRSWNHGAENLLGFNSEEMIGRHALAFVPSDRQSLMTDCIRRVTGGEVLLRYEGVCLAKDGRRIDVCVTGSPIKNSEGKVTTIVAAMRDITGRKLAQDALRKSEVQYRLLFESNPVPMYVFDRNSLRFLAVNEAAIRQYCFTEQDFLAMSVTDIRPVEDIPDLLLQIRQSKGLQQCGIWRHRKKNGAILDVEIVSHSLDFSGIASVLVAALDITERRRSEEAVRQAEERYRATVEDAVVGIFQTGTDGRPISVNRALSQMHGYSSPEEMMAKVTDVTEQLFVNPSTISKSIDAAEDGVARGVEHEVYCKDGTRKWVRVNMRAVRDAHGNTFHEGMVEDITDHKKAEDALLFKTALLEAQTEATIDGILVVDENARIVLINKQFGFIFGVPDELLGTGDDLIVRKYVMDQVSDPDAFIDRVIHLYGHRDERSRDEIRLKGGKILDRYSGPLFDAKRGYRGRIWYFRDITERKSAEDRIEFLAYHDALTELPHRALLADRLENALAGAQRRNEKVALLFIDLDRFKDLNDTFGHSFGDSFLKAFAKRLRGCVRGQDTVARLGGDEFLIMLNGVKDTADAAVAAEHLMDAMKASLLVEGQLLHVGCSIGISVFPEHGTNGETLIKNADAAMYSAKEAGCGKVRFFTDEMNAQALKRLSMENNLRLALERQEFFLLYQPQMDVESGRIIGVEALIRWQSPEMGLLLPDTFISIAESSGLILPIGEWVLRTACAQAVQWQRDGLLAVPVAVNVSSVQFRQEGFLAVIRSVLLETGLAPQDLELELTESLLLSHADMTFAVLRDLKDLGLKLAIDDFGTGYSSLSYLKQFPVSKLKIDRSFIKDLTVDPDDAAITIAIVSMAKSLHLKVIAEGVETEAQMTFLREHRCDEMQGYYFSKPITADQVADILPRVRGHAKDESDATLRSITRVQSLCIGRTGKSHAH